MNSIVDSHFHIWNQQDLPWLVGPMQPRIFGPYDEIRRDYTIEEYLKDAAASILAKSVYVQTNWAPERFEEEVAWVQGIANQYGTPHGIVGYIDLLAADVRPQIEQILKYPLLRGLRMQLHWHENPAYRFARSADCVSDPRLRRNVARLIEFDLPFELQLFPGQMAEGVQLLEENPRTKFILIHAGMLESLDAQVVSAWRQGIRVLAAQPNAYCKLSGLGTFIHRLDAPLIEFVLRECVEVFGADRCLFGSNFPVEKLWTDFTALMQAYLKAASFLPDAACENIFSGTATRLYRL
jgi:predicted TIM-barrel fold metal-dependent hydrolase